MVNIKINKKKKGIITYFRWNSEFMTLYVTVGENELDDIFVGVVSTAWETDDQVEGLSTS